MKKIFAMLIVLTFAVGVNAAPMYNVWHDTDFDGEKDLLLGQVSAYSTDMSSANYYNYFSASAHPEAPVPEAYISKMYLLNGSDGLSLGFFHNKDAAGNRYWNHVRQDFTFRSMNANVGLVDDGTPDNHGEPGIVSTGPNSWHAGFAYTRNTDGGVFNELTATAADWEIHINPAMFGDIQQWQMNSGDGSFINLWDNPEPIPDLPGTADYYGSCNFNAYTTIITQAPTIPEPTTMILFGLGMAGIALRNRFRK